MTDAESRSRRWVQRTLAAGVVASAIFLVTGLVLVFTRHEAALNSGPFKLAATVGRAAHGEGTAVMTIGLLILMLTPVARVLVLGIGWLLDRELLFAGVAATVLVLLTISVVLGTG